jgi:hypothetical protein
MNFKPSIEKVVLSIIAAIATAYWVLENYTIVGAPLSEVLPAKIKYSIISGILSLALVYAIWSLIEKK